MGEVMRAGQVQRKVNRAASSGRLAALVCAVLAERVVVSTAFELFSSFRSLASYSCESIRKLSESPDDSRPALFAAARRVGCRGVETLP